MYTRDNNLIITETGLKKYGKNNFFNQYFLIFIIFSISLAIITGLVTTENRLFCAVVVGFISIFTLLIIGCLKKT